MYFKLFSDYSDNTLDIFCRIMNNHIIDEF